VELGGIEPPSARREPPVIRPFPTSTLTARHRRVDWVTVAGDSPDRLSDQSVFFHTSSVLSRRHPPLLLPGCEELAPCGLSTHDVCQSPENQAATANCVLAVVLFAPFFESEQLGSHARPPKLTSKPVSPIGCAPRTIPRGCCSIPSGDAGMRDTCRGCLVRGLVTFSVVWFSPVSCEVAC